MNKRASSIAKGIGILMMFCHHLFYSSELIARKTVGLTLVFEPLGRHYLVLLAQGCKACVAVFVFITGYGTFLQVSKLLSKRTQPNQVATYALKHHVYLLLSMQFIYVIWACFGTLSGQKTLAAVYGGKGITKGVFYFFIDIMGLAKAFGTPTYNKTWWYLSLAIVLIYLVPLLTLVARRVGSWSLLALACLVPPLMGWSMNGIITKYVPVAILGMAFAQYGLFERGGMLRDKRAREIAGLVMGVALIGVAMYLRHKVGFKWLFEAISAVLVCRLAISLESLGDKALAFVGKHSSNMFMFHTFIYSTFFSRQVYSLRYWWAIIGGLLVVSLLVSIATEWLKRCMRYDRLCDAIWLRVARVTE